MEGPLDTLIQFLLYNFHQIYPTHTNLNFPPCQSTTLIYIIDSWEVFCSHSVSVTLFLGPCTPLFPFPFPLHPPFPRSFPIGLPSLLHTLSLLPPLLPNSLPSKFPPFPPPPPCPIPMGSTPSTLPFSLLSPPPPLLSHQLNLFIQRDFISLYFLNTQVTDPRHRDWVSPARSCFPSSGTRGQWI